MQWKAWKAWKAPMAALLMGLLMGPLWAATDINKASAAELDGIKGIGPALSGRMLEERKKGPFKDWNDLIQRVQGVGPGNAARYSEAGLTVNGSAFKAASSAANTAKAAAPGAAAPAKAAAPAAPAKP